MLETPEEAAERLLRQIRKKISRATFYVALGNSMRFIAFTRKDFAFGLYSDDVSRLVGAYTKDIDTRELCEDLIAYLIERGMYKQ